jgi:hypothetical protein
VGTIHNETELEVDWQPLESKMLAAAAYEFRIGFLTRKVSDRPPSLS